MSASSVVSTRLLEIKGIVEIRGSCEKGVWCPCDEENPVPHGFPTLTSVYALNLRLDSSLVLLAAFFETNFLPTVAKHAQ